MGTETIVVSIGAPHRTGFVEVSVDRSTREVYGPDGASIGGWEVVSAGENLRALSNDGPIREGFPSVAAVAAWLWRVASPRDFRPA